MQIPGDFEIMEESWVEISRKHLKKIDSKRVLNYLGLNELRRTAIIFIQKLD